MPRVRVLIFLTCPTIVCKTRSVTNYLWIISWYYLLPLNSTSNSAETYSKNTIFLRGFGTIRGTIQGTIFQSPEECSIFPRKRNTVTTLPSQCHHLRRRAATTTAAAVSALAPSHPPRVSAPLPLPPLPPLPSFTLSPLSRHRRRFHRCCSCYF